MRVRREAHGSAHLMQPKMLPYGHGVVTQLSSTGTLSPSLCSDWNTRPQSVQWLNGDGYCCSPVIQTRNHESEVTGDHMEGRKDQI
ncbi:hypothetical protein FJT64_007293 [Amphibalanus amphitrite]|uniref:Uncharacterized protein n=1 Tax=Amphibalanus amphitrite TaxID=1232801 RepID=A0A6A4W051_AMPAM|nr:hypothetical protein FJT64_007293 [Amphibalanus amphitrite]